MTSSDGFSSIVAAHMSSMRCRIQHDAAADRVAGEQAQQRVLRQRGSAGPAALRPPVRASCSNSGAHRPPGLPMIS